MTFGKMIRELRHAKEWSHPDLAAKVDVGFTYLSRVENERLNFGQYPSDALIHRLADALEADEEELLILAKSVPERIRQRFLELPDAFGRIKDLDDAPLDALIGQLPPSPQQHSFPKKRIARKPTIAQ
jgi:transcriptional regulator with XRE-family HTH domain